MKKHFRKVLEVLKTRKEIKALGFSRKELKGIAAKIADKLKLEEEATDEEIDDAIEEAVESAMPYLEFSQTVADRRLQAYKDSHADDGDEDEDDDDDLETEPEGGKGGKSPSKGKKGKGADSAMQKMFGELTETIKGLKSEIAEMKSGKTADSRRARLEKLLKDTGKFGERTLKSFSRMQFKDDEEFEDYLDEVEADLEAENQERENRGLETLGKPAAAVPGANKKQEEEEIMSDDEVKALAQG